MTEQNDIDIDIDQALGSSRRPGGKKLSLIKRFLGLKKIILLPVLVMMLLLVGGSVWFFFFAGPDSKTGKDQEMSGQNAAVEIQEEPQFEDVVALAPFENITIVPGGSYGLLNMSIELELFSPGMRDVIEQDVPRIRQVIELETKTMGWLELRGPEGKLKLKFRLLNAINATLSETKIRNLYFTNFIMH